MRRQRVSCGTWATLWMGAVCVGCSAGSSGGGSGGALIIGAGAATLIYSSIKLHKNMETRTRVCGSR